MEKYNFYKVKFISNFIYFISIPIISYIFLTYFYETDILNIKGFLYSYFLGIFLINIFSNIFDFINYKIITSKNNENTNNQSENINENNSKIKNKSRRLKEIRILDSNKEKYIKNNLFFIIGTTIYIILFINFIDIPLKYFGITTGLINLIIYFSKILLFSGTAIPLNIFITTQEFYSNKSILILTINKLLLFTTLGLILLDNLNLKGLVLTISLLELLEVIFKIVLIKIIEKLD